jgi:hypothetical protein
VARDSALIRRCRSDFAHVRGHSQESCALDQQFKVELEREHNLRLRDDWRASNQRVFIISRAELIQPTLASLPEFFMSDLGPGD